MGEAKARMVFSETSTGPGMNSLVCGIVYVIIKLNREETQTRKMKQVLFFVMTMVVGASLLRGEGVVPGVEEIVKKALERDDALRERRTGFEYHLKVTTKNLSREGEVESEYATEAVVKPNKEILFDQTLGEEGKISEEDSRSKKIRESEKIRAVMDLKKLAPRFELTLEGEEAVGGRGCYVVAFQPKPDQPYDSREEKVINKMAGHFWIAKDDYSVLKSAGKLTEPVSVAWFFATMREVSFAYQTQPLPNGDPGPHLFDLTYDMQTTVAYQRKQLLSQISGYKAVAASEPVAKD